VAEVSTKIVIQSAVSGSRSVLNSVMLLWTNIVPILQIKRSDITPLCALCNRFWICGGTVPSTSVCQTRVEFSNHHRSDIELYTNHSTIHTSLYFDCRLHWSNRTITTPIQI